MAREEQWLRLAIVVVALPVMLGAGPPMVVKVDDWIFTILAVSISAAACAALLSAEARELQSFAA